MIVFLITFIVKSVLVGCFVLFLLFVVFSAFQMQSVQWDADMPDAQTVHDQNADNVNEEERDNIPSVYVDKQLLNQENGSTVNQVVSYKVNDSVFYEEDSADDKIVEFEVYTDGAKEIIFKMDNDFDMYCSTPTDSESEFEDDAPDRTLEVSLQSVPHGYLVNSTVYLTEHQWNTLIFLDIRLLKCAACDMFSELDTCPDHMMTDCHQKNLALFKPLERFDLSITRKIRNKYHCAVCNVLFDVKTEHDHYGSKMHEGNLLFAINKASDIIYDSAQKEDNNNVNNHDRSKNNDCYHFNAHAINNDNNSIVSDNFYDFVPNNDDFIDFKNNDENDFYEENEFAMPIGMSYATMAKKPKVVTQKFLDIDLGNKKVKVRFDSWHMVISPKRNTFYCMVCKKFDHIRLKTEHCLEVGHLNNLDKCKVVEAYEEYFIRQVDNKLYHCGHCNNLQLIHEMVDHVETNHPRKRTNAEAINPPKIVSPTKNTSNETDKHITSNHSQPSTPIKNMNKDPIKNNDFQSTVAQNKDTRCNTPIKNNEQTNVAKHKDKPATPIQNKIGVINKQVPRNSANENNNNDSRSISNDTRSVNNDARSRNNDTRSISNDKSNKMAGIFDNLVIYPFGYKMSIPLLSYNIVCERPSDFYCGLCDVICPEHLIARHICDLPHVQLFKRTPFIIPFNCNLIRAIRDALHCAICNMPITVDQIYIHIRDPQHVMLLSKALGIVPQINPTPKALTASKAAPNTNPTPNALTAPKSAPKTNPAPNALTAPKEAPKANPAPNALTAPKAAPKTNPAPIALTAPKTAPVAVKNVMTKVAVPSNSVRIPANTSEVKIAPQTVTQVNVPAKGVVNYNDVKRESNNIKVNYAKDNETNIVMNDTPKEPKEIDEEFTKVNRKFERKISNEEDYDEIENLDETFDSIASEDATFNVEEDVYLKLRNSYIKIANTSYNSLVPVGDGSRYCFVCALQVEFAELQKHVDSRPHLENMENYRFLDKYEDHLLRQIFLMYHCCICNVIITRRELKTHLEWPTHALQNENTQKNIKKTRKTEIKGGVKQIVVSTQKENIYLNEKEPKIKIHFNIEVTPTANNPKIPTDYPSKQIDIKKNKIIIFNDNVLKITWDSWHGVSKVKNGYKCNLCQRELKTMEIETHCSSEWHKYGLDKPFEKQYAPALIRKINESTLNCLICNTEVSNKEHIVSEHVNGKKHVKNYDAILKESSVANTYTDCNDDVLML